MSLMMQWVVAVYVSGLCVSLAESFKSFYCFHHLKKNSGIDLFVKNRRLRRHLIVKPLFWPFYFVIEKSPVTRISETFFKHYGDPGHRYFGNRGLKHFLYDVFKGKDRYQPYQVKRLVVKIESNTRDCGLIPTSSECVEIVCAHYREKFLLRLTFGRKGSFNEYRGNISRYVLDGCEHFDLRGIRKRLDEINPDIAEHLLSSFISKNTEL